MQLVLAEHCYRCHGGDKTKGRVNLKQLTTRADFLADPKLTRKVVEVLEFPRDATRG